MYRVSCRLLDADERMDSSPLLTVAAPHGDRGGSIWLRLSAKGGIVRLWRRDPRYGSYSAPHPPNNNTDASHTRLYRHCAWTGVSVSMAGAKAQLEGGNSQEEGSRSAIAQEELLLEYGYGNYGRQSWPLASVWFIHAFAAGDGGQETRGAGPVSDVSRHVAVMSVPSKT